MKIKIFKMIMLIGFVIVLASCSKSGDPTPTAKQLTALDSVKNAMTGKWNFQSLTLTQIANGKSKTITSCDKSSMDNYYSDGNWLNFTVEFDWVYSSTSSTSVKGSNACTSGSINYAINAVQNTDGTITITFDAGGNSKQVYNVKSKDITANTVKATLVSNGTAVASTQGYLPVFTFSRQ